MSLGVIMYLNFLGKCITCIVEITIHSFYNVRGNNFDSSTRSVSLRKEKTNVRIFYREVVHVNMILYICFDILLVHVIKMYDCNP